MTAPRATYRLQLSRGFTTSDAAAIAAYFAELGVSHLYLSPILRSTPGSAHGYDCVDPTRLDGDRGGDEGIELLSAEVDAAGLGLVLDIVPNHLAASGAENPWWSSVLEHGVHSRWAGAFDIDWESAQRDGGVLVPILGEPLGDALHSGKIRLTRRDGSLCVRYADHVLPLSPESASSLLAGAAEDLAGQAFAPARASLTALAEQMDDLPDASAVDQSRCRVRGEMSDALRSQLAALLRESDAAARAVDRHLERVSDSPSHLGEVLAQQHYRLAYWRRAGDGLNHRRFFDIDSLVGVRVEREEVFEAVHRRILSLAGAGAVQGLRVDHPDGLRDPAGYFRRLAAEASGAWIVAEKILHAGEALRGDWPVAGTTGYDFLNDMLGVLINPWGEEPLSTLCAEFTGRGEGWPEIELGAKVWAARDLLRADLNRLVRLLTRIGETTEALRDDPERLADAAAAMASCTGVYRTYVVPESGRICDEDRAIVGAAHDRAAAVRPDLTPQPLGAVRDLLLLKIRPPSGATHPTAHDEFVARFQQYSAPVTAKGVEDTAFYRHLRLTALNEVGGDPGRFGLSVEGFHAANLERHRRTPSTMLATSTHDTKRSEDVRARLAVLSEIPDEWARAVMHWAGMNEQRRRTLDTEVDREAEYLLYQTLVGAWPIDADRASAYMLKALREAKRRTSWLDPNGVYEAGVETFVRAVLSDGAFVEDVEGFVGRILRAGRVNSLAMVLAKLTCPGVPDIYQGCELWDLSLVDPDNRRPVDFALRRRLLDDLKSMDAAAIWRTLDDPEDLGLAKLHVTRQGLDVRRRFGAAFTAGSRYEPLSVSGERAEHVVAFSRAESSGRARVVTVVPRLTAGLDDGGWADTSIVLPELPKGAQWVNRLSGAPAGAGTVRLGALLDAAPVALLIEEGA